VAAVAVFLNLGLLIWFLLSSLYLGGDQSVLNLPILSTIQPQVLLEWEKAMQDLFPWALAGWIILAYASRKKRLIYLSRKAQDDMMR
jgi:hypothetical protein